MKKNILFMILGMIIMAGIGIGVYAINANEITYNNTTVDQALDTLYQKSNYEEYNGDITITPSTESQILSTNNKLLKSNITIDAIPSTFKELTQTTTATANDLLSGKTAYDNNGNLITGNATGTCVTGSYTKPSNRQIEINLSFTPTIFYIYLYNSLSDISFRYVTYEDTKELYLYQTAKNGDTTKQKSTSITAANNKITSSFSTNTSTGIYNASTTVYYTACK